MFSCCVFLLLLTVTGPASARSPGRKLIVGSEQDFPPFAVGLTDEMASGFTVELWQEVARESGLHYEMRVRPFHQLLKEFKEGKVDVLINLAQSDERREFASFTVPHVTVHGAVFVRKGEAAIRSEADLAGRSIIVLKADLGHDYAVARGWERQLVLVDTAAQGFLQLAEGRHDAMLLSKLAGLQTLQAMGVSTVYPLRNRAGFAQKFSFAVRKEEAELLESLNESLALAKSSGAYDALYEKWFGVYEVREPTLSDFLKYLVPLSITVLVLLGFLLFKRRAEQRLRESEERFRRIVETAEEGIWTTDAQGRTSFANPKLTSLLGYSAAEMLGRPLQDFMEAAGSAHFSGDSADGPLLGTGRHEVKFLRKDGGEVWAALATSPIHDGRGAPAGMLAMVTDVTERRALEQQMQRAQKLESLGVLAGGIAHDYNNLLTAVMGNVSLALLEIPPESPAREQLLDAEEATERAADLAQQMLAYSGKGRFVVARVNLQQVVEEVTQMLQVSISKQATLRFDFAPAPPTIEADVTQLRQIVLNLVINASDAIGDGSGEIRISTGELACSRAYLATTWLQDPLPEGRYAYLEVADTGGGIPEDQLARIFDPFFTTKFTGRGLGLAAVQGIVRGHRGALVVSSEPGKGTSFRVLFPSVGEVVEHAVEPDAEAAEWRGEGGVLLVDDEEGVRNIGTRLLERLGFQVWTAEEGQHALEIFERDGAAISLVVLDLTMPGMGGEETFRRLRQLRPDIRVILSTGYNEHDIIQPFVGQGLAGFIAKPYTLAKLRTVLRDAAQAA